MIALVFSKRRLCSKLSRRKLGGLLFSVIPSATMSVLTSLTFLLGETSGCLMRRYGNSALCNDKVFSGERASERIRGASESEARASEAAP
jgi:hypothetical protein